MYIPSPLLASSLFALRPCFYKCHDMYFSPALTRVACVRLCFGVTIEEGRLSVRCGVARCLGRRAACAVWGQRESVRLRDRLGGTWTGWSASLSSISIKFASVLTGWRISRLWWHTPSQLTGTFHHAGGLTGRSTRAGICLLREQQGRCSSTVSAAACSSRRPPRASRLWCAR